MEAPERISRSLANRADRVWASAARFPKGMVALKPSDHSRPSLMERKASSKLFPMLDRPHPATKSTATRSLSCALKSLLQVGKASLVLGDFRPFTLGQCHQCLPVQASNTGVWKRVWRQSTLLTQWEIWTTHRGSQCPFGVAMVDISIQEPLLG